jgi:hypothetical protein
MVQHSVDALGEDIAILVERLAMRRPSWRSIGLTDSAIKA